jgi:peptide chain release factor 2
MRELRVLRDFVGLQDDFAKRLSDQQELLEMVAAENDAAAVEELAADTESLSGDLLRLEKGLLFSGEHDRQDAYLSVHAGAGGTESCDWAAMLLRMFTKYLEAKGCRVRLVDIQEGEQAGMRGATAEISGGPGAFGLLRSETGVHRLVRISPFDSNKRRHTSFSSVDAIAEIEEDDGELVIPPNEFHVDTFRSGGKGGQNVNKVETAVRITHLPTGLVVASQTQRSQHQNRATAMKLLLSRIYAQRVDAQKAEMERFYGDKGSISWGNQIRSYVFQPYRMVKDLRTGVETSNVQGVMDGDLDPFVNGWLRAGCPAKRMQGVKDDEE